MSSQPFLPVNNPNPNVCMDCGAFKEPGKKKCPCQRYEKKWNRPKPDVPKHPSEPVAASNYHLRKTRGIESDTDNKKPDVLSDFGFNEKTS